MKNSFVLVVIGAAILSLILFVLFTMAQTSGNLTSRSVDELRAKLATGEDIVLLDVRTPGEFTGQLGHIPHSILLPVQELHHRLNEIEQYRDKEVLIICRTDNRSRAAASFLKESGFKNVSFVRGGMVEWNRKFGRPE